MDMSSNPLLNDLEAFQSPLSFVIPVLKHTQLENRQNPSHNLP